METVATRMPKPKGAVLWLMVAIACLWVMFAAALNWAAAPAAHSLFGALAGDSQAVLHGQVWRLCTAALLHNPATPSHALIVVMLLYFFATALEEAWGTKRLMLFFLGSALIAFSLETLGSFLPGLGSSSWYGGMVLADATTVAWALANRHQTVRLFLVIPVRPMVMVALLAIWHVALVIARAPATEGLIAPFGAMLAGWLLCDSSPLRRLFLKKRLGRIQRELDDLRARDRLRRRREGPSLRVIRGGADEDDESKRRIMH
jgi:membrane associated rhomboid family serine protease